MGRANTMNVHSDERSYEIAGLDLKVTAQDLANALESTAASVAPQTIADYEKWNKEFASV